jgi:hypothetical protein
LALASSDLWAEPIAARLDRRLSFGIGGGYIAFVFAHTISGKGVTMPLIEPSTPRTVDELEDLLSQPTAGVIRAMGELDGDILVLGVGGKMGPTLAQMAQRASQEAGVRRRVIGVSRFSTPDLSSRLRSCGVETISCDLLDAASVAQLPAVRNVVYMAGLKFGTSHKPSLAWAMNCLVPAMVSQRYRDARIAVFSSGNVYGLVPRSRGGSVETDETAPVGEYAITVLGRERIFEYFSQGWNISMALLRLNYATELRYGVLVDLAQKVIRQEPIDVRMGYVNVIWQRDANAMALQSLTHVATPPLVLNIAGPEILRIRDVVAEFSRLTGRPVRIAGEEADDALLSNARKSYQLFGQPEIGVAQIMRWTADWVSRGGESLGKPTHFESREGKF